MNASHSKRPSGFIYLLASAIACGWVTMSPVAVSAAEPPADAAPAKPEQPSTMVRLIQKLAEHGSLSQQDAQDLIAQSEADAADARVTAAEALLASAKAEAAAARARAEAAQATAALLRAQASAAQLSANQAAAVRLLLGGTGAAAAPDTARAIGDPAPSDNSKAAPDEPVNQLAAAPAPADVPISTGDIVGENTAATAIPDPTPDPADADGPEPDPAPRSATRRSIVRTADGAVVVPDDIEGADAGPAPTAVEDAAAPDDDVDDAALAAEATKAVAAASKAAPKGDVEPPAGDALADNPTAAQAPSENDAGLSVTQAPDAGSPSPQPLVAETRQSVQAEAAALENSDSGADTGAASDPKASAAPTTSPDGATVVPDEAPTPAAEAPAAVVPDDPAGGPTAAAQKSAPDPAPTAASQEAPAGDDDAVKVSYVPDVVREQIAQEVKEEVLAQARKENWGSPASGPEWVSKFTLYGDIRVRAEEIVNHSGNNNTGAFPNFNAINTGAPFDTSTISNPNFSPQLDVDQNRNRERLRARLGATVDMKDGWTVGMRAATGNDNNPVTENQTFGAAGNAQGGDFSKYAIWLDRAYIKYQSGGNPDNAVSVSFGRFDNPFFSTSLIWANEIGMDGAAARIPAKLTFDNGFLKELRPFLVIGAFPVFNTDLNFGSDDPAKFKSYDKWLGAGQLGLDAKFGGALNLKIAAALYAYKNIQGQISDPFTPVSSSDSGDTDESRPAFAQNGNTYMPIRDITPGPSNDNGTIDQWQYYGLATAFKEFAVTEGLTWNQFEPFQVSLVSEWVKNLDYNRQAIQAVAVNNLNGTAYVGGNMGWMTTLKFGDEVLDRFGDWNASFGYRYLQSDAVVDGFDDADFGGVLTGTNLKGPTVTASLGLHPGIWLDLRWMGATAIVGPTYRNDLLQFDLNAKF